MPSEADRTPRRTIREIALLAAAGGVLVAGLRLVQYRFLVLEHSVEIYAAVIAAIFAGFGIWLGRTLVARRPQVIVKEVPVPAAGPFTVNAAKVQELGLTARELEILGLIASGLSTREMAAALFVSENTVKTHASRLFDKLGARRRTQAVQLGKAAGLLP